MTLDTAIVDNAEMQSAFAYRAFNDLARGLVLVGFAPVGNTVDRDAYLFVKLFEHLLIGSDLFRRRAPQMRAMGSVGLAMSVLVKKTWHLLVSEIAPDLHIDARLANVRTVPRGLAEGSVNAVASRVAQVAHVHNPSVFVRDGTH
jgi:hypothetical protein